MNRDFDAVAFDLDGTLYPNYSLYIRLIPFIIKEHRLLRAMGKARDALRSAAQEGRFYDLQARIMAEILKQDPQSVKDRTERLIYRGWEPIFKTVKTFPGVRETLSDFKNAGLPLGLLSDFPPERKLEYLGLTDMWDAVLCSEVVGSLKPHRSSFLTLARSLRTEPERILYVGNSVEYDVRGAKGVGMRTALITLWPRKRRSKNAEADFIFSDYRQLRGYVLS